MTFKSTCPGITGRICGVLNSDFVVEIYNFGMHRTMALQFRQKIQTISLVEVNAFSQIIKKVGFLCLSDASVHKRGMHKIKNAIVRMSTTMRFHKTVSMKIAWSQNPINYKTLFFRPSLYSSPLQPL